MIAPMKTSQQRKRENGYQVGSQQSLPQFHSQHFFQLLSYLTNKFLSIIAQEKNYFLLQVLIKSPKNIRPFHICMLAARLPYLQWSFINEKEVILLATCFSVIPFFSLIRNFSVNNLFTDLCQTAFEDSSFQSNFFKISFKQNSILKQLRTDSHDKRTKVSLF